MTDRKLLELALEALEGLADTSWTAAFKQREYNSDEPNENFERERVLKVITALRERLARCDDCGEANPADIHTCSPQRLAQSQKDWDWRHPKAQALIGAKARLEITLRLIEQLLEDPHFETTASDMEYWEPLHDKLRERLAQPEQEPVAWVTGWHDGRCVIRAANPSAILPIGIALYTTPPRREWVGLTDEEIAEAANWVRWSRQYHRDFARAIEAKLKEKNA